MYSRSNKESENGAGPLPLYLFISIAKKNPNVHVLAYWALTFLGAHPLGKTKLHALNERVIMG